MAPDKHRDPVPAAHVLGELLVAPLPEGTKAESVFMLVKLDDGDWCARSVGADYNRTEFLGQLVAYTHGLTVSEAEGWFADEDPAS
ncbi:hypothetical protein ABH923_000877 [Leifsonia sp. EB41]|jgi:hypothetical protein|uniref:hypothetical protein n=1 Tax=Leifsonia sp. EB41 TaxID=3156260 RepID=UPI0035184DAB